MPDLAVALREEIIRLARKQVRAETESLRKASAGHRSTIAALRRQVDALQREVNVMRKLQTSRGGAAAAPASVAAASDGAQPPLRFRPEGLASHRKRLGLSAADFGKLVGVTGQTIHAWEQRKSRPRPEQMPAIATVRRLGQREALRRLGSIAP